MTGPSPYSMWPDLLEVKDPEMIAISTNLKMKKSASDKDKMDFERYENEENRFFIRDAHPDMKDPYYTWEGDVVEKASLKGRKLPAAY